MYITLAPWSSVGLTPHNRQSKFGRALKASLSQLSHTHSNMQMPYEAEQGRLGDKRHHASL